MRFASRFGFLLEDALLSAAQDIQVRDMLGHKVSRERIGTELEGMFKGPDPVRAVDLLKNLGLFEAVFEVHPSASDSMLTEEFARAGANLFAAALEIWDSTEIASASRTAEKDDGSGLEEPKRQMMVAALLLPLRSTRIKSAKGKPLSMSSHIIRDSLKWKAKDAEAVDALHAVAPRLAQVYHRLSSGDGEAATSAAQDSVVIELGRCMRDLKTLFVPGMVMASLVASPEATPLGVDPSLVEDHVATLKSSTNNSDGSSLEGRLEMCKALLNAVDRFELNSCWAWKPVLDGKRVMGIMGMAKGGPVLGKLMDKVVDWQLLHPHGSAEECEAWLLVEEKGGGEA